MVTAGTRYPVAARPAWSRHGRSDAVHLEVRGGGGRDGGGRLNAVHRPSDAVPAGRPLDWLVHGRGVPREGVRRGKRAGTIMEFYHASPLITTFLSIHMDKNPACNVRCSTTVVFQSMNCLQVTYCRQSGGNGLILNVTHLIIDC